MFHSLKKILATIPLLLMALLVFQGSLSTSRTFSSNLYPTALAREEEDEEDEDEDYEDRNQEESPKTKETKTVDVIKEVIEYKPVVETVTVLEEAYKIDTDGDKLVDALDPDPLVDQREYFTDTDEDGIPNALDQYHDEDDFTYYEAETDDNNNGIIDSYEA